MNDSKFLLIFLFIFLFHNSYGQTSNVLKIQDDVKNISETFLINKNDRLVQKYYFKVNGNKFKIEIEEQTIVHQADKMEKWGYVQFPSIQATQTGDLVVMWSLKEDNIESDFKKGWKYSKDLGKSWNFNWKRQPDFIGTKISNNEYIKFGNYKQKLSDKEEIIHHYNIKEKSIKLFKHDEPFKVDLYRKYNSNNFIKEISLLNYFNKVYGYSVDNIIPNFSWGNVITDTTNYNELYKIQYPIYLKSNFKYSSVALLVSNDKGKNWNLKSYLNFGQNELALVKNYITDIQGFDESSFTRLNENNFIIVNRTTTGLESGPLLQYKSNDKGHTWTGPKQISPNGVYPQLLKLNDDILVLSTGRPGVQLRFSNSNGENWSEPINFISNKNFKGQTSCGYTGMYLINENSFLLVYSDFTTKNEDGKFRKSIIVRKINIKKI